MKKAFTLAEILITLCITGIVASLIIPSMIKLRPDSTKITYLKIYDSLSNSIKSLSSNSALFPICQDNINCKAHPLINTSGRVTRTGYVIPQGNTKLCQLLSDEITTYSQNTIETACDNMQGYEYSDETFYDNAMHTRRGQDYLITTHLLKGAEIEYQTDIYFDINGIKEPNCIYSKECKNPDRFKLMVAADGSVIPADAVGQRYIIERKNLQKVPLEIAANTTAVEENLQDGLRKFLSTPCSADDTGDEISDFDNNNEDDNNEENEFKCGGTYDNKFVNCIISFSRTYQSFDAYSNGRIIGSKKIKTETTWDFGRGDIKLERDKLAHIFFLVKPAGTDLKIITGYSSYNMESFSYQISFINGFDQSHYFYPSYIPIISELPGDIPVREYPIWGTCTIPAGQQYCIEVLTTGFEPYEQLYDSYSPCFTINSGSMRPAPHINWTDGETVITGINLSLDPSRVYINPNPADIEFIDSYNNNIGRLYNIGRVTGGVISADNDNIYVLELGNNAIKANIIYDDLPNIVDWFDNSEDMFSGWWFSGQHISFNWPPTNYDIRNVIIPYINNFCNSNDAILDDSLIPIYDQVRKKNE